MLNALKKIDYVIVLVSTLLSIGIAVLYLHLSPYAYRSNMVIITSSAYRQNQNMGAVSSLLLHSGNSDAIDTYSEVFLSPQTVSKLAYNDDIMEYYFGNNWDKKHKTLKYNQTWLGNITILGKFFLTGNKHDRADSPSGALLKVLGKRVKIQKDNKTSMVRISFTDTDPGMASYVLQQLHKATDMYLRGLAQKDADETSRTLESRLSRINSVNLRDAAVTTLINQEVTRLLTGAYASYMISVLIPPTTDPDPISPNPRMILLLALLLGFGFPTAILVRWRNGWTIFGLEYILSTIKNKNKATQKKPFEEN